MEMEGDGIYTASRPNLPKERKKEKEKDGKWCGVGGSNEECMHGGLTNKRGKDRDWFMKRRQKRTPRKKEREGGE